MVALRHGERHEIRTPSGKASGGGAHTGVEANGDRVLKICEKVGIGTSMVQRVFNQQPW
jgi:hypothetical protein